MIDGSGERDDGRIRDSYCTNGDAMRYCRKVDYNGI